MARRYGGEHSPSGNARPGGGQPVKNPYAGARRSKAGGRVNFLFVAPLPLALRAFMGSSTGLALNLAAFGLMILAAWLTREGILAQEAYESRKIARRPALPRKILGALLTGLGLAVAGFAGGSVLNGAIFGLLGAVLHFLAFGPDPLSDKGMQGVDLYQSDRVARAVEAAEQRLAQMKDAILRAQDRALEARVDAFQATVREMLRTVEDDPRDLTASRKYLGVYLSGARDATAKFADIYARSHDAGARADYERLLDDLEANFTARTELLLDDCRTDLDVEIEVLRERLAREGVSLAHESREDQENHENKES